MKLFACQIIKLIQKEILFFHIFFMFDQIIEERNRFHSQAISYACKFFLVIIHVCCLFYLTFYFTYFLENPLLRGYQPRNSLLFINLVSDYFIFISDNFSSFSSWRLSFKILVFGMGICCYFSRRIEIWIKVVCIKWTFIEVVFTSWFERSGNRFDMIWCWLFFEIGSMVLCEFF